MIAEFDILWKFPSISSVLTSTLPLIIGVDVEGEIAFKLSCDKFKFYLHVMLWPNSVTILVRCGIKYFVLFLLYYSTEIHQTSVRAACIQTGTPINTK